MCPPNLFHFFFMLASYSEYDMDPLENGNNELLMCWLSGLEKKKPEDIPYSKTLWLLFLVLFLPFSHISLQAAMFTALGLGNVSWIFRVKGSWPSLEESPKAPKKVVQVTFEVGDATAYQPTAPQKKLVGRDCDVMLCI